MNFLYIFTDQISFSKYFNSNFASKLNFQDYATLVQKDIEELHETVLFYLLIILFIIIFFLFNIIYTNLNKNKNISLKYLIHGTTLEIIWTILPAIILIFIAIPSFRLLYFMDEIISPILTVKIIGHQ